MPVILHVLSELTAAADGVPFGPVPPFVPSYETPYVFDTLSPRCAARVLARGDDTFVTCRA